MSDGTEWAAILVLVAMISLLIAAVMTRSAQEEQNINRAIDQGCAHYDSKTGDLEWKTTPHKAGE